jgi:hypothetical protein
MNVENKQLSSDITASIAITAYNRKKASETSYE